MFKTIILFPAYGRKYATAEAMVTGWKDGKDFRFPGGPYCSVRDLEKLEKLADKIVLHDTQSGANAIVWVKF